MAGHARFSSIAAATGHGGLTIRTEARSELLSRAFDLRSKALKGLGRLEEASRAAERAVREGRTAAQTSEAAKHWLPMLLMNLSNRYGGLGRHREALDTIGEAVAHLRRLEGDHPDPLSPNTADALVNYAQCLQDCGMSPQARETIAEAVARLQRLTASHPKFRPKLDMAVAVWASYLSSSPVDDEETRTEYEQVIGLLDELSAAEAALRVIHAKAMSDFGTKLLRAGDRDHGRQWRAKGVRLRRELLAHRDV